MLGSLKPQALVTDDDIDNNHFGNFGSMSKRRVVDEGVLKAALGYASGSTARSILYAHGLIEGQLGDEGKLTKKGQAYLRALFAQKGLKSVLDFLSH